MRYCKYCGKQIKKDSIYCKYCGHRLIIESTEEQDWNNDSLANVNDLVTKKQSGIGKKIVIIVTIFIAIVLVGVVGFNKQLTFMLADSGQFNLAKTIAIPSFTYDKDTKFKKYINAGCYYENKEYSKAKSTFSDIKKYRNSSEFYSKSCYNLGLNNLEQGYDLAAYSNFDDANGYLDSDEQMKEIKKNAERNGVSYYNQGDFDEAWNYFGLANTAKSKKYMELIDAYECADATLISRNTFGFADSCELVVSYHEIAKSYLNGVWYSNDGHYFTMDADGYTTYDLPWFEYGDYYYIEDGEYRLYPEDNMMDYETMYIFSPISWNECDVYCYQNNGYYTIYRQ